MQRRVCPLEPSLPEGTLRVNVRVLVRYVKSIAFPTFELIHTLTPKSLISPKNARTPTKPLESEQHEYKRKNGSMCLSVLPTGDACSRRSPRSGRTTPGCRSPYPKSSRFSRSLRSQTAASHGDNFNAHHAITSLVSNNPKHFKAAIAQVNPKLACLCVCKKIHMSGTS